MGLNELTETNREINKAYKRIIRETQIKRQLIMKMINRAEDGDESAQRVLRFAGIRAYTKQEIAELNEELSNANKAEQI